MASDDVLSWLRVTIEGDKAAAEAADKVSPGPWVNIGQAGDGGAWQIHGAPTGDVEFKFDYEVNPAIEEPDVLDNRPSPVVEVPVLRRVATLNYDDGGGVWEREAADHIVLQQPTDTIARCQAELKLLDKLLPELELADDSIMGEWGGSSNLADDLLAMLATGYRHRPGFNPDWLTP